MFDFTGKRALITGAGAGIGRAVALRLAQSKAEVVAIDRDAAAARKCAEEAAAFGGRTMAEACDVANPTEVRRVVSKTIAAWGGIDLLVNNAGISLMRSFLETSDAEFSAQMDVNLGGAWNFCQAVLPQMIAARSGAVVNMSSWSGKTGRPMNSAYGAAKFALIGLTQSLAHEMGPFNIRVNAICPGLVVGTAMRSQTEKEMQALGMPTTEERARSIPLRRVGQPDDVADMALFLLSDAASYVTGEAFNVTGGLWMG